MNETPIVDSCERRISGPNPWSPYDHAVVASEDARKLEIGLMMWRGLADRLAQRVRSFPQNDARDREVLRDYEIGVSKAL